MRLSSWIRLAEACVGVAFLAAVFAAWRADRRDRAQLQTQLAVTQKTIADLTAQQNDRSAQLAKTLAQMATQKQAVRTPEEAIQNLPAVLPLPSPIRSLPPQPPPAGNEGKAALAPSGPAPGLIPAEDLKPLYDFATDCKECQAKLASTQADLADEKAKSRALQKESDDALRAAKGGSVLRRIGRAAKWLIIGAAAGALAVQARH
jgi:hypothetical protein